MQELWKVEPLKGIWGWNWGTGAKPQYWVNLTLSVT